MGQGDQTGGSQQLAELIDEHGGELYGDLLHHYGIDLRDLFSEDDPLDPGLATQLILGLPAKSNYHAARRGGVQFRGWDQDRYINVATMDTLRLSLWAFICANSDPKKPKPKAPEPYPYPDDVKARKPADKPGSFASIVKRLKAETLQAREAEANGGWSRGQGSRPDQRPSGAELRRLLSEAT